MVKKKYASVPYRQETFGKLYFSIHNNVCIYTDNIMSNSSTKCFLEYFMKTAATLV